jgi:uncharacterized protein
MSDIKEFVATVARSLVDSPDAVEVSEYEKGRQSIVRLYVAPDDMGRIIGRDGRIANALRAVLQAVPGDKRWGLEVVSEES